ncbi:MAG: thymidylate synthase [Sellimonas intestinalis]
MSYADQIFVRMCKDIIDNGTSTEGERYARNGRMAPRPTQSNSSAVVNRYDLSKEFPALTLRRTGIKSCTDEMLWIWQRKSNNIHDLKPHIWDSWADPDGSIGKAYGYQMQSKAPVQGGHDGSGGPGHLRSKAQSVQQTDSDQYLCTPGSA